MSLSQKHSGKVLVPWFNIAEWNSVYNLIYSETGQDWRKALDVLRIWKLRTPLLSVGVEGTLILLEALLVNRNVLSSYECSHIFSTSVVRFLNLCAAYSDKQGTFYKTALQNELPKWLINLRHDIAHSHKVPSLSMLEMGLRFCLDWLKDKYWDVQYDNMSDFIVETTCGSVVEDSVYIFENLNEDEVVQGKQELRECVNKYVEETKGQIKGKKVLENVCNALREEIKINKEAVTEKLSELLIHNLVILSSELEVDESGNKKIPSDTLIKWNNLLNVMLEAEILHNFVYDLFKFLCDESHDFLHRETASLWIKNIFTSIQNKHNNKGDNCLVFRSKNDSLKRKEIAVEMLEKINRFTSNFIQEVLEYNNAPVELINDSISLISTFNRNSSCSNNNIFTIEDLNIVEETSNDINRETPVKPKSRWILIEDTTPFLNLPLGILPHQDRNKNPLLDL